MAMVRVAGAVRVRVRMRSRIHSWIVAVAQARDWDASVSSGPTDRLAISASAD